MSAYSGPQHKGASATRRATKRAQAESRNAATPWNRRAAARKPCPFGKREMSEAEATVELVGSVLSYNRGNNHRQERRAYQCPACGWWHLTSKPLVVSGGAE